MVINFKKNFKIHIRNKKIINFHKKYCMKKLMYYVITMLFSLTCIISCQKSSSVGGNNSNNNNNNNGTARILLAGYDNQGYPVMYDGSTKVNLDTNGKQYVALGAISVNANDIYLTSNGGYWKNGIWYSMLGYCQNSTQNTQFSTVFVKGNSTYVAGRNLNYNSSNRYDTFRVWKNGVQVFYKIGWGGSGNGSILNINDQGDFYLYLAEYTSSSGTWPNTSTSGTHSIYKNSDQIWYSSWTRSGSSVSTQNIPLAFYNGTGYNVYTLLEVNNNQLTQIRPNSFDLRKNLSSTNSEFSISPTSTSPYFLYYSGSCFYSDTCYVSGYESGSYVYGKYWKNGEEHILFEVPNNIAGHVGGIDVKDTTVYVAGRAERNSGNLYWKNGVPVTGPESFECRLIKVY